MAINEQTIRYGIFVGGCIVVAGIYYGTHLIDNHLRAKILLAGMKSKDEAKEDNES